MAINIRMKSPTIGCTGLASLAGEPCVAQASVQGPIGDFAWIVPTPSVPEIQASSQEIFAALEQVTRPIYRHRGSDWGCLCSDTQYADVRPHGGDVTIYDAGTVGIYATHIVGADEDTEIEIYTCAAGGRPEAVERGAQPAAGRGTSGRRRVPPLH